MMQKEEVDGSTKMHHNHAIHTKIDARLNPYANEYKENINVTTQMMKIKEL